MKIIFLLILVFTLSGMDRSEYIAETSLKISDISVNSDKTGLYEKLEISFHMKGTWDNPFDSEQIKADGYFYAPDGRTIVVPGFYYQDYKFFVKNGEDIFEKSGAPLWKIRFTPSLTGEYKFQIIAKNGESEIKTPVQKFLCIRFSDNHGFLRISEINPLYFDFDDGTSFIGIAMDKASGKLSEFEKIYKRFADAGGNYNRLFLTGGTFNIEEQISRDNDPEKGLGRINLDAAWKLDKITEIAELLGIYHQLCLTNQTNFRTNSAWNINAYNKANGGILSSPEEYFTSEDAMKYFERRLRYIIARWGYSTSVFSWNLWNEVSAAQGFNAATAVIWHKRMADFITSIDPFKHIIHTNDGKLNGTDEISSMPEMQIVSTNIYAVKNIANISEIWTKRMISKYNKQYILTEYGIGHNLGDVGGYATFDPERIMVHNGIWSPLMNGSASTGMAWDWNWLDHESFYSYIKAVSLFAKDIPFSKYEWVPVNWASFKFLNIQKKYYSDIIVEGWPGNFGMTNEAVTKEIYMIDKNGNIDQQDLLHAVLGDTSGQRNYWCDPSVTFMADFPVQGEFVIYISELRGTNPTPQLTVSLDSKQVLKKDLLPLNIPDYHPRIYNQYFSVNVPKGLHEIKIENTGGGRFVTAFELKNFIFRDGPDLEVRGMQSKDYILLWLKNQKFTILHDMNAIKIQPQPEGLLELRNVPDGTWLAEWFNTVDASCLKTEIIKAVNNKLLINTPSVQKSVALRLKRI